MRQFPAHGKLRFPLTPAIQFRTLTAEDCRPLLDFEILQINPASMRVLEKSGFMRTDATPKTTTIHGRTYDCHEFAFDL